MRHTEAEIRVKREDGQWRNRWQAKIGSKGEDMKEKNRAKLVAEKAEHYFAQGFN